MDTKKDHWLGLPKNLFWGYVAIFLFMTGDGFELAFLSKYMVEIGFTPAQATFAFTVYGLCAALAAWGSGVIAEVITPQKAMKIGFIMWVVFHVLFMVFGLTQKNYYYILLFYGIRGLAYPLFLYSFIVVIVHNVREELVGSACGWFWAAYSLGIGVIGSYLPSLIITQIGELNVLWFSLIWVCAGGLLSMVALKNIKTSSHMLNLNTKEKLSEMSRAVTLLMTNKNITLASIVRIINTLSLYGFAIIMPLLFVGELGFSMPDWLQIWAIFFFSTIVFNVFWGIMSQKWGMLRLIRWYGCIGCAVFSLLFYYLPIYFGDNFWIAALGATLLGASTAAFVPMTALFPALEPKHKGAAISVCNLSAGLSNFFAPAIATALLPFYGVVGVVYAYSALYIFGFVLTLYIQFTQKQFGPQAVSVEEVAS
ncbi:MFS transporter [Serratia sp. M24T3]|uniref:MFS transporter n=1 Tax=Serratia sp. M24T3 TaxID=932213 RepID=UPI00025B9090|nr:MFS transporter [Serratia sp. M24T3]EIC84906.1 D-arabitol membrane transporter [Serratia sp. M24T3]